MDKEELNNLVSRAHGSVIDLARRGASNLFRAKRLLDFYRAVGTVVAPDHLTATDLLRATVVFAHASLEDFLRTLALARLPIGDADKLARISLIGSDSRSDKFTLAQLAAHRTSTVQDVITESVRQHLAHETFNNTTDIAAMLERCGIDTSGIKPHFPALDEMIQRRHQIVHQADLRDTLPAPKKVEPAAISADDVERWLEAARLILAEILMEIGVQTVANELRADPSSA